MPNRYTHARVPSLTSEPSRTFPDVAMPQRRLQRALQRGTGVALSLAMIGCAQRADPAPPAGHPTAVSVTALLVDQPLRTSAPMPAALTSPPAPGVSADSAQPTCPPATVPSAPKCTADDAIAASGLKPGRPVDSLAIRFGNVVRSSVGVVCSTAENRLECEAAARVPYDAEHLITTEGDEVRIWGFGSAHVLLSPIDTVEEALWLVAARGYSVPCGAPVIETEAGFEIANATRSVTCGGTVTAAVVVDPKGTVIERVAAGGG